METYWESWDLTEMIPQLPKYQPVKSRLSIRISCYLLFSLRSPSVKFFKDQYHLHRCECPLPSFQLYQVMPRMDSALMKSWTSFVQSPAECFLFSSPKPAHSAGPEPAKVSSLRRALRLLSLFFSAGNLNLVSATLHPSSAHLCPCP